MPLQLKPFALIGLDAAQLWPLTNLVLPAWLLLAFAPSWRHTAKLTLIPPLVHSLLYALCVLSVFGDPSGEGPPDFGSLQGVVKLFQDPNGASPDNLPSTHTTHTSHRNFVVADWAGVFAGWVHYLVFDLFVGRWIVEDSQARGCSLLLHFVAVVPCLVSTLMLGPLGFLCYFVLSNLGLFGAKPALHAKGD